MKDAFGVEISKGMPRAARAIGNDLLRNPDHNFAPFSEIISPKKTNYVVFRHDSYTNGREAAKAYAKFKQDPVKPDPHGYGFPPSTRTQIKRDFGRNSKLGFGPKDIASGHLHRFTGVTKPADIGGKTGWKAMLDENNAKKLPNINRDNYISQRPKASQDKLRAFIKRRDRKARGEISKGVPRAARAFASKLDNHPDTNFAAAHEMLNPRDTNYIVFRSVSRNFGRNAAKFASNKKKTPSIAANSPEQNKIYSQSMIDDGKAYKRSVAPIAAYSAKNKHAFEGAGGFGGYHGWKPMLDKSRALKKLPNVTRDNYISQRSAASQAKLKDFIKRRDRKARGEISKGLTARLPVKLVERLGDGLPRRQAQVDEIARQMGGKHGFERPVNIAISRSHNLMYAGTPPKNMPAFRLQDGHHRVLARKQMGKKTVKAEITLRRKKPGTYFFKQKEVPRGEGNRMPPNNPSPNDWVYAPGGFHARPKGKHRRIKP